MDNLVEYVVQPGNGRAGALLVGSHTRKNQFQKPSDKDYVIVTPEGNIAELTARIRSHDGFQDESDDSLRVMDGDVEYGLCLLSRIAFQNRISNVLSDNFVQKDWAIGSVMPEGFYGDVEAGIIESDTEDNFLERTKIYIQDHKSENIAKLEFQTLKKLQSLAALLKKHKHDIIHNEVLKGQILIFLIRLFYLRNNEFCKGIKHFSRDSEQLSNGENIIGLIDSITRSDPEWITSFYTFLK